MHKHRWQIIYAVTLSVIVIFGSTSYSNLNVLAFALWPVDTIGYTIEELPVRISASCVRGNDVYLGLTSGQIFKTDDTDMQKPWIDLNSPLNEGPRLLFVSSTGAIFASPDHLPTYRSKNQGQTWEICLDIPVWRMDEDDQGFIAESRELSASGWLYCDNGKVSWWARKKPP